jgi:hypothetical protein
VWEQGDLIYTDKAGEYQGLRHLHVLGIWTVSRMDLISGFNKDKE